MGSTTYEWLLDHENLLEHPEKWFYPGKPAFVLSSRAAAGRGRVPTSGSAPATWRSVWIEILRGRAATATSGSSAAATSSASSRMPGCSTRSGCRSRRSPSSRDARCSPAGSSPIGSDLDSVRQAGQFAELVYSVRNQR